MKAARSLFLLISAVFLVFGCKNSTSLFDLFPPTPLSAPTGLTMTGKTANTISVSWNAVTNATGYGVYCTTGSTFYASNLKDKVYAPNRSYTFTGLSPGVKYRLGVDSFNNTSESPTIAYIEVTTNPTTTIVDEPVEVTVGANEILSVTNMSVSIYADLEFNRDLIASAVQGEDLRFVSDRKRQAPKEVLLKDLPAAMRFNANPPPPGARRPRSQRMAAAEGNVHYPPFWVENKYGVFVEMNATAKVTGDHCTIWLADGITGLAQSEFDKLAAKFDAIYPLATNLLGYEYGGGLDESDPDYGGMDGDPKIQILVYDMNFGADIVNEGGMLGYFYPIDAYTQEELDSWYGKNRYKSNYAEIFYIDSGFLKIRPDDIYSTLIHEFQHMINYNQKELQKELRSGTWYNEMLAMLAEDVIGPLVGINPTLKPKSPSGHPIDSRIPIFLDWYDELGVDEWADEYHELEGFSYYTVYGFGAYLVRNFGGPELIKEMLSNNFVNHNSVTQAMKKLNPDEPDYSFDYALENYGEALVYSTSNKGISGKLSFDIEASSIIEGVTYTAQAFDIYKIQCADPEFREYLYSQGYQWMTTTGPFMWPYLDSYIAIPHSVCLHYFTRKYNVSCSFPEGADIKLKVYK